MSDTEKKPVRVFVSYSHVDFELFSRVKTAIGGLVRGGLIEAWTDHEIGAGEEWSAAIQTELVEADVVLCLISPDFMDSDYCHNQELNKAIARHKAGEAAVIPVLLCECYWEWHEVAQLQAVPITVDKRLWWIEEAEGAQRNRALAQVARRVHEAIKQRTAQREAKAALPPPGVAEAPGRYEQPASPAAERLRGHPRNVDWPRLM